jgi:hypothetical protein
MQRSRWTARAGNPAGVVLDASGLDAAKMQAIAADVGYSETAFLSGDRVSRTDTTFATLRRYRRCRSVDMPPLRRQWPWSSGLRQTS